MTSTQTPTDAVKAEARNFATPDDTRTLEKARIDFVSLPCGMVAYSVLQPGWRWSENMKPVAKTEWCEVPHLEYQVSGTMRVHMRDGSEYDIAPGELGVVPSGHDAWVVGDEPAVAVDFAGVAHFTQVS